MRIPDNCGPGDEVVVCPNCGGSDGFTTFYREDHEFVESPFKTPCDKCHGAGLAKVERGELARPFTAEEAKVHAEIMDSMGEVVEENVFEVGGNIDE